MQSLLEVTWRNAGWGRCLREMLDNVIALNESRLRRILRGCGSYHHRDGSPDYLRQDRPDRRPRHAWVDCTIVTPGAKRHRSPLHFSPEWSCRRNSRRAAGVMSLSTSWERLGGRVVPTRVDLSLPTLMLEFRSSSHAAPNRRSRIDSELHDGVQGCESGSG
jgi:hypothetical protein